MSNKPVVFLSPSTQEYNPYVTEGNEEYYMNKIADAMEPLLRAKGIAFVRNDPNGSVVDSVNLSNANPNQLHVALHSNAAPTYLAGKVRGVDVYYYPTSEKGKRAAEIFARNLRDIYCCKVQTLTSTSMYELKRTNAPAVLLELGYHDNPEDEAWIRSSVDAIAQNLVKSIAEYFGM